MSNNQNNTNRTGNFDLPGGYFERSAASIANKIEWMEELAVYPQLVALKKQTGFVVPHGYFESSEVVLEHIAYPNLSAIKKQTGFVVPENYFENLQATGSSTNKTEGENELAEFTVLSSIPKEPVFALPVNYFENNSGTLKKQLAPAARVLRLKNPKLWYSAAAAVLTITLGLWVYSHYFATAAAEDCGTLACVDKNDLVKEKNLEALDNDQLYEIVDTKKLQEKLDTEIPTTQEKQPDTINETETDDFPDGI